MPFSTNARKGKLSSGRPMHGSPPPLTACLTSCGRQRNRRKSCENDEEMEKQAQETYQYAEEIVVVSKRQEQLPNVLLARAQARHSHIANARDRPSARRGRQKPAASTPSERSTARERSGDTTFLQPKQSRESRDQRCRADASRANLEQRGLYRADRSVFPLRAQLQPEPREKQ